MLDANNLKCCGMHLRLEALLGDALKRTVALNQTLGNTFLIVAAVREKMRSVESVKQFAATLNALAAKARALDMRVGYHAHGFDFTRFAGRTAWDLLFSLTVPEVVMQLDTGNCAGGGGNPVAILKKFPGRATTIHIREYPGASLASGQQVWQEIFRLCETPGRTEWYIVEQGGPKGVGLDVPRQFLEGLRKMGK